MPFDTALVLAGLSARVLGEPDREAALRLVVRTTVDVVPRCHGSSLTLRERGMPAAFGADDAWAEDLDRLQLVHQEGPCLDCMREGSVMRVRDLATDGRFPSYGPAAAERGAVSAASFPLTSDGQVVGALNLYSREVDAFGTDTVGLGMLLAAHAALALQAAQAFFASQDLADRLQEAMGSRAFIEQAKGVLMRELACDAETAFQHLVEQSQRANTKLRDVAAQVVRAASGG